MNFFRGLNKEQWTATAVIALAALMLLSGFSGGITPATETLRAGAEEPYIPLKARTAELPDDKFDHYWKPGTKLFSVESGLKLPMPVLKAPEPREEEMPAPPFRPGPVWETYNKLGIPGKYPMLTPAQPLIAEANLPTAAELADLLKMEEPAGQSRVDQRDKQERETAVINLKSGAKWEVQEITDVLPDWIMYKDKSGARKRVGRAEVKDWLTNNKNDKQYQIDTEAIKSGPREVEERVKLAQRVLELGMIPEAKAELKKAVEVKRDNLEAILLLGQVAQEASDYETAMATYRAGIDAGASPGELWYEIGRCLRAVAFYEGALSAFEKSVEAQPRLHRARLSLARALLEAGQHNAAIEYATDFFTKMGTSPDTTAAHRAEASLVRGLAYMRAGVFDKARADFAETLKTDAASAEALNGNGAALALEGQLPQAGPEFVKAIRANQYLTDAWTNLAALFLLGGKWDDAAKLSQAAYQRDPASVEAVLGLGLAQLLSGNKDAPKSITAAAQIDPQNLQVLMVTGLLRLREGQDDEALLRFVSALRQEYHFLPAYSGAAAAYLRTARKLASSRDEASAKKAAELRINAATLIDRVLKFDATRPGAWVGLACAYAVMQRPAEARDALRKANRQDPLVFYALGYIEAQFGEGDERARLAAARREFDQGAKLETTATDPFSQRIIADCKSSMDAIDQWGRTTQRLSEAFEGPDSKNLGPGWIQSLDKYGVSITRENHKEKGGRARFGGKQVIKDWGLTSLSHEIQGGEFHSFEITLLPERILDKSEFGVSLFHTKAGEQWQGLSIGFDPTGKVRYSLTQTDRELDGNDMNNGWTDIKVPLPDPKNVQLKITAGEVNRVRAFTIWFWSAAKGEWIPAAKDLRFNANAQGPWRIAAWVRAWRDQDLLLYVDNIKVLDQARR